MTELDIKIDNIEQQPSPKLPKDIWEKVREQARKDLKEWFNKYLYNKKERETAMSTSQFSKTPYGGDSRVEVPKVTMLDSIKHLINGIDQEVRRKEWAIETNNRELVEGKDKTIEELHQEIVTLEEVLDLIPDYHDVVEKNKSPLAYSRRPDRPEVEAVN